MAAVAEKLEVVHLPEQLGVSLGWLDVVYFVSRLGVVALCAGTTDTEVSRNYHLSQSFPASCLVSTAKRVELPSFATTASVAYLSTNGTKNLLLD